MKAHRTASSTASRRSFSRRRTTPGSARSISSRPTLRALLPGRATVAAMDDGRITRRDSLLRLGGFAVAALGLRGLEAQPADAASVACVLTPEQTEGPYYIAGEKLRRNITEGRLGAPLVLRTFVVDAATCRPI